MAQSDASRAQLWSMKAPGFVIGCGLAAPALPQGAERRMSTALAAGRGPSGSAASEVGAGSISGEIRVVWLSSDKYSE